MESNHSPSRPDEPSSAPEYLISLQEIIHKRIRQKKGEIHKSHNIAYTNILWAEIETLHWVLAQILTMRRRTQLPNNHTDTIIKLNNFYYSFINAENNKG